MRYYKSELLAMPYLGEYESYPNGYKRYVRSQNRLWLGEIWHSNIASAPPPARAIVQPSPSSASASAPSKPNPRPLDEVAPKETPKQFVCSVCMVNLRNTLLKPCNHQCVCVGCSDAIKAKSQPCPICRGAIEAIEYCYQS